MNDDDFIKLAQTVVPAHLQPLAKIVQKPTVAIAAAAKPGALDDDALAAALAKNVGAQLGADDPDSADVEFVDNTQVGTRATVVQIRAGKIARVLKRA